MVDDIIPQDANSKQLEVNVFGLNTLCTASAASVKALPFLFGQGAKDGRSYSATVSTEPVVGIVECTCSAASTPVSSLANNYMVPAVSESSTHPGLGNKGLYPYFMRVVPLDSVQGNAFAVFTLELVCRRALACYCTDTYCSSVVTSLKSKMSATTAVVMDRMMPSQSLSVPSARRTLVMSLGTMSCCRLPRTRQRS